MLLLYTRFPEKSTAILVFFSDFFRAERDEATAQLQLDLCHAGVEALRVHNVAATLRAITAAGF